MTTDIRLHAGRYDAAIAAVGGGLRELTFDGKPLTDSYPAGTDAPLSAGVVLAPWPNRIGDGVFEFHGTLHQLEITEPARSNAIHGFVLGETWAVTETSDTSATLLYTIEPREGWPWRIEVTTHFTLDAETGLTCEMGAENLSDSVAPFGVGMHTYLNALGAPLNDCHLNAPASKLMPLEPTRNLPCGPVVSTANDPRRVDGIDLGETWLDYPYTGFAASEREGRPVIRHTLTCGGDGVELWTDPVFAWAQIYTADPSHNEGFPGRGRAIAVEPMTCPPEAFRNGIDVIELQPGSRWVGSWGMAALDIN